MKTELLSAAKADLLWLMKRHGRISIKEAVRELDLSSSTLRQHLSDLERDGFIKHRSERHGVGRPRKVYVLRSKAGRFFERRDQEVLSRLVRFLSREGDTEQLERFFERYGPELVKAHGRDLREASRGRRREIMEGYLSDRGYAPEVHLGDEGELIMDLYHCPFATVARESKAPCQMEIGLLEKAFGGNVEKRQHQFDEGVSHCRIVVMPPDSEEES